MSRVPRIRFKGFEEDWEQRKLGECFTERIESMPNGELISVTINDGIKKFSELGRHDNSNDDKSKYKKVCVGDIAYNSMRMWQGASGYSPYEGIVSPAYTVLAANHGVNSRCIAHQFKLSKMIHTFKINSQGITSDNWNLKFPTLSDISIYISRSIDEQGKIASLLESLDHLITLHQRKLEKLKIIKKSMLENLFPQNGEKTPKIRFSGFNEDWEQRKLGEMVEFYNGDRSSRYPNDSDMVFEGIPFINAGDLVLGRVKLDTANKITEEKYNQLSGAKIQCGDIIYCLRGTLGKNAFVDNFDIGTIASSLVDIRPQKIVGKYLFQVLNSDIEYSQRILNDEGAAQPNLSAKNLYLFDIPIPRDVEQIKIAEYLESLDHLITLHQLEPFQLIFKAIAYRIIDYTKSKPPRHTKYEIIISFIKYYV